MRLNRFLASSGLGSRRSCESLILEGRVTINGTVITGLATEVQPDDQVKVNRRLVRPLPAKSVLLHKPKGYVSTKEDPNAKRTVYDLLPKEFLNLGYVGRLDKESEGLLLFTSDGMLAQALTRPSSKVDKEYEVVLDKPFDPADTAKLLRGIHIEGGRAKMESVRVVAPKKLRVVLHQGIKRQIRVMLYKCGYEVEKLLRLRIGPVRLGGLLSGRWRYLDPEEMQALLEAVKSPGVSRSNKLSQNNASTKRSGPKGRTSRPGKSRQLDRTPRKKQNARRPSSA